MDIYNVLDYADIDLTFILVGQEQLESQRLAKQPSTGSTSDLYLNLQQATM